MLCREGLPTILRTIEKVNKPPSSYLKRLEKTLICYPKEFPNTWALLGVDLHLILFG